MKRLLSIAAVTVALVSLSSCKKDYTCTCTVDFMGEPISTSTTINATKGDAKEACEAGSSTGVVCEIK
jgi:hypothetical protein